MSIKLTYEWTPCDHHIAESDVYVTSFYCDYLRHGCACRNNTAALKDEEERCLDLYHMKFVSYSLQLCSLRAKL